MTALARIVIRFRVLIVAFWVIVAAFAIPRASRVNEVLSVEGRSIRPTEASRVQATIESAFQQPLAKFIAVALSGPVPVDSTPFVELIDVLTTAAASLPYIADVFSYATAEDAGLISDDRKTTFLIATFAAP